MSSSKCKNCGCSEIDVDPARGDAVCINCGSVLESNIIVSTIQFEDNVHGGSSAIGQFVASDSKGGARGFGGSFHPGLGVESREITLRNAKKKITHLAHQMRLNQHCIETAFNFFKMALSRHLTRGRKTGNVVAACVYMTCRTEGTAHMLIDLCDVLDSVSVYELGRTYLRLSQALCINIPSIDPCLYILRFANRLEFGEKTHEVSMTALRLVQRMKRDSIHTGRRPSGLCGAALLMAARLHEFSRSIGDIIKIVKVHESTLRKRLVEFGDTPSSSLTLDEFMTVDLEEEQDPPSFKAARRKDHLDRVQKALDDDEMQNDFNILQQEIERELEEINTKRRFGKTRLPTEEDFEKRDLNRFVDQSTMEVIQECIAKSGDEIKESSRSGIGPSFESLGLTSETPVNADITNTTIQPLGDGELIIDDLDDKELDQYIMSERETQHKDILWNKINEKYLKDQKEKEEKLAKEKEEGKPERKRRKYGPKKAKSGPANTAGEAIEKMLQEKKISNKINYDVLKSLTFPTEQKKEPEESLFSRMRMASQAEKPVRSAVRKSKKLKMESPTTREVLSVSEVLTSQEEKHKDTYTENDLEELPEDVEAEPEADRSEVSLRQLLNQHRDDGDIDEFYGEDDEEEDY